MTESEITRTIICPSLEAAGAVVIPFVASRHQKVGVPDRRVESLIWSGWFEAKLERNRLSTAQAMFLRGLSERRSPSLVMRYWPEKSELWFERFDGALLYDYAFLYEKSDRGHDWRQAQGQQLLTSMSFAWEHGVRNIL